MLHQDVVFRHGRDWRVRGIPGNDDVLEAVAPEAVAVECREQCRQVVQRGLNAADLFTKPVGSPHAHSLRDEGDRVGHSLSVPRFHGLRLAADDGSVVVDSRHGIRLISCAAARRFEADGRTKEMEHAAANN
jgi:hypothetical protein